MFTRKVILTTSLVCVLALAAGSVSQENQQPTAARQASWFLISPADTPEAHEWYPAVAYNNMWQEYLVVWHASTATNRYVYGQFVSKLELSIGPRFMISPPVGSNWYADVAYNPTRNEYLVVYMVGETNPRHLRDADQCPRRKVLGLERCFASNSPTTPYRYPAVAYETSSKASTL